MKDNTGVLTRRMEKTGDDLSILGYGCMRFPRKYGRTDMERTEKQIVSAIERGVNYFDTAYIYPGSEEALGTILAKGYRDRVKIATKMPIQPVRSRGDMDSIFNTQLKRLRTDHIDYYLIHNITAFEIWKNMEKLGVLEFIEENRRNGRITNIGFSTHGNLLDFKNVVDDYPWDFCQIQYNYLDENFQAGKEGLKYAAGKGLGIVVMEPLRGGMLVNKMPPAAKTLISRFETERTPAEWGLRWVWNHPEVSVVLSGMGEESQIDENIRIASDVEVNSLTEPEFALIASVKKEFQSAVKVNCTGCAYCMPCPHGVNIPQCFAQYNSKAMFGGIVPLASYVMYTDGFGEAPSKASVCKECGVCESKCPQSLPIMKLLKDVANAMENPFFRVLIRFVRKIMFR
jgi:predicted aldo/keto reductase-like oxidoreductase